MYLLGLVLVFMLVVVLLACSFQVCMRNILRRVYWVDEHGDVIVRPYVVRQRRLLRDGSGDRPVGDGTASGGGVALPIAPVESDGALDAAGWAYFSAAGRGLVGDRRFHLRGRRGADSLDVSYGSSLDSSPERGSGVVRSAFEPGADAAAALRACLDRCPELDDCAVGAAITRPVD